MPKTTYESIQKQIEKLEREAETLKKKEMGGVIQRIREAIAHYDITPQQLFGGKRAVRGAEATRSKAGPSAGATKKARRGPVAPKYRDEHGNTWAGRGNRPRWLSEAIKSGRKLEDFAI